MSYLALARKWRPRTFSQLVGQDHINNSLINALKQQRLHHAYLFTGTRGVGKTSIARILAKALNCEQGISPEPCLKCDACTAIEQSRFIDLIEIDAASKTRVEDTRDLLENIHYSPATGRYKIYLIDEVHMLSQHSFNALLKTLEEPPAHVKFILATTDPQKLPVTVLSRCLQFNLKHLAADLISKHLQTILNEEQLDFEIYALELLAEAARGSMRDALSLLDQMITACDKKLTTIVVKKNLGYTQQDYALKLLQALADHNASLILTLTQQITTEGSHFNYVLDEILKHLHHITLFQCIGDNHPLIQPSEEIKLLSTQFSPEDTQLFYQIALKGCEEIHFAPTLSIGFNMTLLRMLTFRPAAKAVIPSLAFQSPSEQTPAIETIVPIIETPNLNIRDTEEKNTIEADDWINVIPQLKLTGLALNALENAEFISKEGKSVNLSVEKGHQSLFTPSAISRIEAALSDYYKSPVTLLLSSNEAVRTSPAQQKEKAAQQRQEQAEVALEHDPVFQQLQQEFSAKLVKNSIVPLKNDL